MQITTYLLTAVAALSTAVSAESGYLSTCNSQQLFGPGPNSKFPVLTGNCKKLSGIYSVLNAINMDRCVGNQGGRLVAQFNGGFGGSCKNYGIDYGNGWMHANCGDRKGGWPYTTLQTNSFIGNDNGVMKCYGGNSMS